MARMETEAILLAVLKLSLIHSSTADLLDEKYLLVQRGKKNYYLVIAK